jgi:hypothetical protein
MRFERLPVSILGAISKRVGLPEERPSFMQGLAMGALVGAAIAGSTLWSRWRARTPAVNAPAAPGTHADPASQPAPIVEPASGD